MTARAEKARLIEAIHRAPDTHTALDIIRDEIEPRFERLATKEVNAALAMIDGVTAPLAAWRAYETTAEVNTAMSQGARAAHYRKLRNATLRSLADSFADGEPLRRSILGAIRS